MYISLSIYMYIDIYRYIDQRLATWAARLPRERSARGRRLKQSSLAASIQVPVQIYIYMYIHTYTIYIFIHNFR